VKGTLSNFYKREPVPGGKKGKRLTVTQRVSGRESPTAAVSREVCRFKEEGERAEWNIDWLVNFSLPWGERFCGQSFAIWLKDKKKEVLYWGRWQHFIIRERAATIG